jgi:hypothetical protein
MLYISSQKRRENGDHKITGKGREGLSNCKTSLSPMWRENPRRIEERGKNPQSQSQSELVLKGGDILYPLPLPDHFNKTIKDILSNIL